MNASVHLTIVGTSLSVMSDYVLVNLSNFISVCQTLSQSISFTPIAAPLSSILI